MNWNDQDLELIESFLDGSISESQMKVFNEKLKNPDFKKEVEFQRNSLETIISFEKTKAKNELKTMLDESNIHLKVPKYNTRIVYTGLAFLLLALASYFIFYGDKSSDPQTVFAEAYIPFPADNEQRDFGNNTVELQRDANSLYASGEYALAVLKFEELISLDMNIARNRLFLANSYISIDQENKAIEILNSIKVNDDKLFVDHVDWYLLMAYLKKGDLAAIENQILKITGDKTHYYTSEAQILKSKLK